MKKNSYFLVTLLISTLMANIAFSLEVILPITSNNISRDEYEISLLKLVLEKAGEPYEIKTSNYVFSQTRILTFLESGGGINLYWMGTSAELEEKLLPIRYPINRGLLGYRVFIIHKNHQEKFDNIQTLADLQKYQGAQGIGWSDNIILESAGLKQYQINYDNIFKMINAGNRIDYFSRGANEAWVEVEARKNIFPYLAIEKKILLVYPFCQFFFTSRSNQKLARVLEKGFQNAYNDGSFMQFFSNHPKIKSVLKQTDLNRRIRIEIPNPLLTKETAAIPAQYWHEK